MPCALVFALAKAGKSIDARMAIMAMTTNNSISVNAADTGKSLAANSHAALIGRATPNPQRLVVWPKKAFCDEDGIGVVFVASAEIQPASDPRLIPGGRVASQARGDVFVKIARVHDPGETQLFKIAETLNALRLGLRLG